MLKIAADLRPDTEAGVTDSLGAVLHRSVALAINERQKGEVFNTPQGAHVVEAGVHYRVWAPVIRDIQLELIDFAGNCLRTMPLLRDSSGYFGVFDEKGRAGDLYKFRLDGIQSCPDPASRWQPGGVHGPSMVVDPKLYRWEDGDWCPPHFRDLIIYELHIGAFTTEGTFRGAIAKLPHLRDLGVNAIEIMPVADFAGERNWGYDGVYLCAPARCYGTPDDLRALVDAAHGVGIAVILDVVYNHFGPDGNYLGAYIGDYLDESAKTPWGGAIRYGHPDVRPLREFIVANPAYWMREFHIDGFRLDATHAIFDASPRHVLAELTANIHQHGGFAIAEDSRNEARLLLPEGEGGLGFDAVWADDFHHVVRVANTDECEAYLADYQGSMDELADTLHHGWHYRGHWSPSEKRNRGTECKHLPPQMFVHCISNHDQVGNRAFGERLAHSISPEAFRVSAALLCLTPYTPMLFMGQEWAASTPFLFFTDHSSELGEQITDGRRQEFQGFKAFGDPHALTKIPDPQKEDTFTKSKLIWAELEGRKMAGVLELYKACLSLRSAERAFRPNCRESFQVAVIGPGIGAMRLNSKVADWLILFDLHGGHEVSLAMHSICEAPSISGWKLALSTNDPRFGGEKGCAAGLFAKRAHFHAPELVVLRGDRAPTDLASQ